MKTIISEEKDPLLAELLGEGVEATGSAIPGATAIDVTRPDKKDMPSASAAPAPMKELDVTPVRKSRVKTSDAQHATHAGGKGYHATLKGEAYFPNPTGRGKILKPYQLRFRVPSADGFMGLIVGKLLLPALQVKYPGAIGYRTHDLVDIVPVGDAPAINNLAMMSRAQLIAFIKEHGVGINVDAYGDDVVALRESVIDHHLNPAGFAEREAKREKDALETRELRAMNPDIFESGGGATPA